MPDEETARNFVADSATWSVCYSAAENGRYIHSQKTNVPVMSRSERLCSRA